MDGRGVARSSNRVIGRSGNRLGAMRAVEKRTQLGEELRDGGIESREAAAGFGQPALESHPLEIRRGVDDEHRRQVRGRSFQRVRRGVDAGCIGIFDRRADGCDTLGAILEEHFYDIEQQRAVATGVPVKHRDVE
jgi:hypothetical protein